MSCGSPERDEGGFWSGCEAIGVAATISPLLSNGSERQAKASRRRVRGKGMARRYLGPGLGAVLAKDFFFINTAEHDANLIVWLKAEAGDETSGRSPRTSSEKVTDFASCQRRP